MISYPGIYPEQFLALPDKVLLATTFFGTKTFVISFIFSMYAPSRETGPNTL
jgi:hypothetical protein